MTKKLSMEEAQDRVTRFYQQVEELWAIAVTEAQEIVKAHDAKPTAIAFDGFSNGYHYEFSGDTFSYRDADGQWHTLVAWEEEDEDSWTDLRDALAAFRSILPPQDDRRVEDPSTLGGFEQDLWLHLFADLDASGNFQWDPEDRGTLTIVEGLYL